MNGGNELNSTITVVTELFYHQLQKMVQDHSWVIGGLVGIALSIPAWVFSDCWTISHTLLVVFLLVILGMDWLAGARLARKSKIMRDQTEIVIDSLIRDGMILVFCFLGFLIDYELHTHSIVFASLTSAFIYHNLRSVVANFTALGWNRWIPLWLFHPILKWIHDELHAKVDKYFPDEE